MAVFELTDDDLVPLQATRLANHGVREREDLQRILRHAIHVIAPECLVLAEEYGDWEDSRRRIDLLCLDKKAKLIVVELKRGESGGHMDLQAVRYAAMVSTMTFEQAVRTLAEHAVISEGEAEQKILEHLELTVPAPDQFALEVGIVLVSGNFDTEVTTTALWLIERGIDVRCVRLGPLKTNDGRVILDVTQIIPPPGTDMYQAKIRSKTAEVREARRENGDWTGWWFVNIGEDEESDNGRSWEDSRKYGFVSAGGGPRWVREIKQLSVGDKIFAYVSGSGYVGAGIVTAPAVLRKDFVVASRGKRLLDLPMTRTPRPESSDPERAEWCVAVEWGKTVDREHAQPAMARRQSVCRMRDAELAARLMKVFGVEGAS